MADRLLTVAEVANRLHVSRGAVYRLVEQGRLAVHRIGGGRGVIRVSEADLNAFLEACRESKPSTPRHEAPKPRLRLRHLKL